MMVDVGSKKPNKLINEKSPYLLQHAYNPVEWYPWTDEAFNVARELNRPLFVSIGYSSCHWCRVMERESFENMEIAKFLNDNFVSVKVDREERLDVDRIYMSFVQAMCGHGGWPLTVFITPDKKPFLGGTYFPPYDTPLQSGFSTILKLVSDKWKADNEGTINHADHLSEIFADSLKRKIFSSDFNSEALSLKCYENLKKTFDSKYGGFGSAPKFPEPSNLVFLSCYYAKNKSNENGQHSLKMVEVTLQHMANGGIHDHIGSGFHRYSVDEYWHVPHFEKMLYDQGQLLSVYARATMLGCNFEGVVKDIVHYVSTCLESLAGVFYSSEDADSLPTVNSEHKIEGAFYVWKMKEVVELLRSLESNAAEIFCKCYGIIDEGNVRSGELKGTNVPIQIKTISEMAEKFKVSEANISSILNECRKVLSEARDKRPHCDIDNKIITGWNCLLATGLLDAARALPDLRLSLIEKAERIMKFILENVRQSDGSLRRSAYVKEDGSVFKLEKETNGFADDYSYFIQSAIDLYELTSNELYLQKAEETFEFFHKNFFDFEKETGYFISANAGEFFVRPMGDQDGAEPSANSVAAMNCLRLGALLDREDISKIASQIFSGYGELLSKTPRALPFMLNALCYQQQPPVQIILCYEREEDEKVCRQMKDIVLSHCIPGLTLFFVNASKKDGWLLKQNAHLRETLKGISGPTALICHNNSCSSPISDIETLKVEMRKF